MRVPFFLLLLSSFLVGCRPFSHKKVGEKAPDFSLRELGAKKSVTLSSLNQQNPVLLIFWASWCPGCVEEIPLLNQWQHRYGPKGLKILGVNVEETEQEIVSFKKSQPVDYPILLDSEAAVARDYGIVGLPASIFLDRGGEILYYGFSPPPNVDELLQKGR